MLAQWQECFTASVLSTSENAVQIVGEKEETLGLYLILEELPSRIVGHCESCGIAPFEEPRRRGS
jgi:hypothetical protein